MMAAAVESGEAFGLYQRINYGVSVIWLGTLAWMLTRLPGTMPVNARSA